MKTATEKNKRLLNNLINNGIKATFEQAEILRRAELTLHRWSELKCGNSNQFASYVLQRDEKTGKPYMWYHPNNGKAFREKYPDKEKGALNRIKEVCKELDVHYYYQTDPRGAALYVSIEPLNHQDYHRAVCCSI